MVENEKKFQIKDDYLEKVSGGDAEPIGMFEKGFQFLYCGDLYVVDRDTYYYSLDDIIDCSKVQKDDWKSYSYTPVIRASDILDRTLNPGKKEIELSKDKDGKY